MPAGGKVAQRRNGARAGAVKCRGLKKFSFGFLGFIGPACLDVGRVFCLRKPASKRAIFKQI